MQRAPWELLVSIALATSGCGDSSAEDSSAETTQTDTSSGDGDGDVAGDGDGDVAGDGDGDVAGDGDGDGDGDVAGDGDGDVAGDGDGDEPNEWLEACPEIADPISSAIVDVSTIDEASGMIASRTYPGVLWVHNDSGDSPRFFALDEEGALLGTFELESAAAVDWEDMAIGAGPEPGEYLYLGDIGDNAEARPDIAVYRTAEPDPSLGGPESVTIDAWERIELVYPDGAHNAETLIVDPISGDLAIVTKGGETELFMAAGVVEGPGPHVLEAVEGLVFPSAIATAGDISPLGDFVVVRTYAEGFLWLRPQGSTLAEAFASPPCELVIAGEPQGETLAIGPDGRSYFTLSEMLDQPLWRYELLP